MSPNACKLVKLNGDVVKMYYVGTLARRLNRCTESVRLWERKGVIPRSWFTDKFGKRLYTEEMISEIVRCAEKNKIVRGSSLRQSAFSIDCHAAFNKLHKKYFGGENNDPETEETD